MKKLEQNKYLVLNAGSSSLKFSLYEMPNRTLVVSGIVERIGEEKSSITLKENQKKVKFDVLIPSHKEAIGEMTQRLFEFGYVKNRNEIQAVGHRILHGGEIYSDSVVIDDEVMKDIHSLVKFGPLHLPGEILGIESIKVNFPTVPQVAVFDTGFHQTLPEETYRYAVPKEWYQENGVRKYGFHGTSHKYITEQMQTYYEKEDVNLIVCHVGSGASITCIKNGVSYDTTMGLTPLDGMIMGTRSGSIDPSIIEYITKERRFTVEQVNTILNQKSGLYGIAGKNDFRDLEALAKTGDKDAILAIKMLEKSIIKSIGEYYFQLEGNLDAIVFTAGLGENAITLRESVVNKLSKACGITLDSKANQEIAGFKEKHMGAITTPDSQFDVLVVPTDEESMILKDTYQLTKKI